MAANEPGGQTMQRRLVLLLAVVLALCVASPSLAQENRQEEMNKVYQDESHCLTSADMRGEKDDPVSCFCRDAIVEARYVHSTYLLTGKDRNLYGVFLRLVENVRQTCAQGQDYDTIGFILQKDWKWNGPEVVRTYPSDDVIKRIEPEKGRAGRWVPFTVQLVYRDAKGRVTKTENYSSREYIPDFQPEGKHSN